MSTGIFEGIIFNITKDISDFTPKRVFSTSVFIPMECRIDSKSHMYFTGLVKLVETFKERTKFEETDGVNNWFLYIYYDSMFDINTIYKNSNYMSHLSNNKKIVKLKKILIKIKIF